MKYQILNYLVIGCILLLLGCNKGLNNPVDSATFTVKKEESYVENPQTAYISKVVSATLTEKTSQWGAWGSGAIWLRRAIGFDLTLANGAVLNVEFNFENTEVNKDLLILDENSTLSETSHSRKHWQYIDKSKEISKFYNNSLGFKVNINNTLLFFERDMEQFDGNRYLKKVSLINLDGEDKIYLEIEFEASVSCCYISWSYDVKNGVFTSIMD